MSENKDEPSREFCIIENGQPSDRDLHAGILTQEDFTLPLGNPGLDDEDEQDISDLDETIAILSEPGENNKS